MRSLKISILFLFFVSSFVAQAQQNLTKSSVTAALKQGFVEFVENVRPFYSTGDTYINFKEKALLGVTKPGTYTLPPVPVEGEDLLSKAYQFLAASYTSRQLLEQADYKAYGKAVLYINNYTKSRNKSIGDAEVALFGGNEQLLNNNPLIGTARGACKWWQLWCHLDQIFGNGGGGQIIQILIDLIVIILL